jgi:hypothetical protein
MGHPTIDNETPFAFAPLFVADEEGTPVLTTIVKATLDVLPDGYVVLADNQKEVNFAGEHYGEPATSSLRFEPETAFVKDATDCVLLGHAVAPEPRTQMTVSFRIGALSKTVRVIGDRVFEKGFFGARISDPVPFERVPLIYERAFGGWDRTSDKESHHECESRNPVGVGFAGRKGKFVAGAALPNIEDPKKPLTSFRGRSVPVGFGFIGAEWNPRSSFAGTFDEAWSRHRSPLLPLDFDRRFFQAASNGLTADGYLRGDEEVQVVGATAEGRWTFHLPGWNTPLCSVTTVSGTLLELPTKLDTVIVDADERCLILLWRAFTTLRSGPHDVTAIRVTCANAAVLAGSSAPS